MGTARKKAVRRKRPVPGPADNGHIEDCVLKFEIRGGKHDGKTIEMDPMLVKLASERLERLHELQVVDGRMEATADFATALNAELEALGYDSTPTIAIRAWIAVNDYFAQVQKKTR